MIITLMRHGKVDGPPGLYGHTDIACSPEGQEDMTRQLELIPEVSQIISSPRIRCLDFATALSKQRNLPLSINNGFAELSFGDWDGVAFDDMQHYWSQIEAYFNNPGEVTPPNGECLTDFYQRICNAWQSLLATIESGSPLLICHGGVIRMVLASVMQVDFKNSAWFGNLDIRNASITQIQLTKHQGRNYCRLLQIGAKLPRP